MGILLFGCSGQSDRPYSATSASPSSYVSPPASHWVPVVEGKGARVYISENDIVSRNNGFIFWVLRDYDVANREAGGRPYHSSINRLIVDCENRLFSVIQFVIYSDHNGSGEIIASESFNDVDYQRAVPGTFGETVVETMCSNRN